MSKLIPRKIKKACKAYRNDVPLKQSGCETTFSTKYGELLSEYIDYGTIL